MESKHVPWRKTILIPFWVFQLFTMLSFVTVLGLAARVLVAHNDKYIIVPLWLSLAGICIILTITEIILLARHNLKPLFFLISNIIKSTVWTVILIVDNVMTNKSRRMIRIVVITLVILFAFYGPLIYSSMLYHRFRLEKSYAPVDPIQDTSYPAQSSELGHFVAIGASHDIEAAPASQGHRVFDQNLSYDQGRPSRSDLYDPHKTGHEEYSDPQGIQRIFGGSSPPSNTSHMAVPQVFVEHHDGQVFEMAGPRDVVR